MSAKGGRINYWMDDASPPAVTTIFAGGLMRTMEQTRRLVADVKGRRVFFGFRGHDGSTGAIPWTYGALAREMRMVADHTGATRAFGVCMGAHALIRILGESPDRFSHVVLMLPIRIKEESAEIAMRRDAAEAAVRSGCSEEAIRIVSEGYPEWMRRLPSFYRVVVNEVKGLSSPPFSQGVLGLRQSEPLPDPAMLAKVTAETLILVRPDDPDHPQETGEKLAELIPRSHLAVLREERSFSQHARSVNSAVSSFFNKEEPGYGAAVWVR